MAMATTTEFATIARILQQELRAMGLTAPAFRCPPHHGADRALKRVPDHPIVLVRLGRDLHAVTKDLIDGCVAANGLTDPDQIQLVRDALWKATGVLEAA